MFEGSAGNDVIIGTDEDDILVGGAGDDILTGGEGDDIFRWNDGDQGEAGSPARDVVTDFGNGQNVLDVSDLLDDATETSLSGFIIAKEDGDDTVLYISSAGELGGDEAKADQTIRLEGKSFSDFGGASASQDVINYLLNNDQLKIDQ
ncbi:type I secretion C-terminal target domain-containing protein [Thioalkalivibrio sp. ALJ16]|uniref:type I secretion C-terminal target domain-containing protein n=1 Tax=Thioalkalivibrio sp. ALJ16 TaxID=1158762 RepID=UPI0003787058|nr:type I secretion C-terminal target domain-containing protein [Thioalkalivibrio sp. ALJ16]